MDFEFGCFLSYRHGEEQLTTLVQNIRDALVNELDFYLDIKEVFQDQGDIGPGEPVRETISAGLCKSVVMVLIYIPKYFSKSRLFCSSELEGMLRLEKSRSQAAGNGAAPLKIIIPILIRGSISDLPADLKNRNPVDFTGLSMATPEVMRDLNNMNKIREIAKEINRTFKALEATGKDFCGDCGQFMILDEKKPAERVKIETFVANYQSSNWQPEFVIS